MLFACVALMETKSSRSPCSYSMSDATYLTTRQGSVFVEFADISSVETFLSAQPKPSWNGNELVIMTKYVARSMNSRSGRLTLIWTEQLTVT